MKSGCGWWPAGAVLALFAISAPVICGERPRVDPNALINDIRYLSSDRLKGRASGSAGLHAASEYLASQFAAIGLQRLGGSYLQPFRITTGASLGPENRLSYAAGRQQTSVSKDEFIPFNFSGTGSATGQVVFAGYGISAPECSYDDYAGVDAHEKIVVVLRHEPQEYDGESCFEGRVYTEHSQLLSKALNARAHGARALISVNDTVAHSGPDALETFNNLPAPRDPGIPFVQVKSSIVEQWFRDVGRDFASVQQEIDRNLAPASFAFAPDLTITVNVDIGREDRDISNVVGYLPGTLPEYIIVGAHYDHLGTGEQFSLAPNMAGTVHPGADDNASGTSGVLAIARRMAKEPKPARGVLFLAFAGEELGLLGSTHYVHTPLLPLADAVAMINMDMIGRMRDKHVIVGGVASGDDFAKTLDPVARKHKLNFDTSERAVYGSSDHTTFRAQMVPVLFFFTGLHGDYHRPTDTADKIDAKETAELVDAVADVVSALVRQANRPKFVSVPVKRPPAGGVPSGSAGAGAVGNH